MNVKDSNKYSGTGENNYKSKYIKFINISKANYLNRLLVII